MTVRLPSAECGKCGASAPVIEWARTALGVAYLVDASTGAEHARTCAGVSPRALPIMVRPVAEPEPVRVRVNYAPPSSAPTTPEPEPDEIAEPDGYAEWLAEGDQRDEIERAQAASRTRAELGALAWPIARRAILANGGIGPSPDWPRDWIPGDLYREHGQAPDIIASEARIVSAGGAGVLAWGEPDEAAMFDYLHRAWEEWQAAQAARRPRARKSSAPTVTPAQALAEPAHASPRDLLADVARLVADVADLVAYASTDAERTRYARMARTAAELAAQVRADV